MRESGLFLKDFCFPHGIKVKNTHLRVENDQTISIDDYKYKKRIENIFYKQKNWRQRVINTILLP